MLGRFLLMAQAVNSKCSRHRSQLEDRVLSGALRTRIGEMQERLNRHFPDNLQIHGDHTQIAPPLNWFSLRSRPIA